ncbi:MAG TPA: hypothetical protein VJ608_14480 [Albitalea sp.]|nr:hypothetical protein [Albitalea sp.]
MHSTPLRFLLPAALALAAASAAAAPNAVAALRFDGGIGVDPLTAAGGVDVPNVVRGISPGGRAWVIRKLDATVYADASVEIRGKGLLFASGEAIATRGPVTHVAATLACGPADATAAKFSTGPAELSAAGDFTIRGPLLDGANTAVLPASCENPQLLIRGFSLATGLPGGWFAVGIRALDD